MENISARTINELLIQKLNTPEGRDKIAQEGSAFIRTKLREISFARKIVNPFYVTKADLQRSVQHDGMVKIVDIEPDSKAMVVNFRGEPNWNYLEGPRFEIPFFFVSSENFQKTEEELLAYEMPLTEVIEKNSVLDIQRQEDESFISQVNAAITAEGSALTGTYDSDSTIKKSDFKRLFDVLDGNELKSDVILMDSTMYNRLFLYDASTISDAVGAETFVNGYTYATIFGRRLVVSNKRLKKDGTALLTNTIFAFTHQDFFAQFLILNDVKFWIEKKKNIISFAAYESIGMGIGNTKACAKITLS